MNDMIEIKNIQGNQLLSVSITQSCQKVEELMAADYIQLSWNSDLSDELPLGAYIEHNGERYSLLEPYKPTQKDESEYTYTPKFESRVRAWGKKPFFFYSGQSKEPDWTLTSNPADFMRCVCDAIREETGESWTYSIDASLPASASLSFSSSDILSGLNQIAGAFETEWFADKKTNTLYLGLLSHGSEVTLEVGKNISVPSVQNSREGYYTRFYAFGSTRNITQDYSGSNTNNLVNKRLTLDPNKYPQGYKDIRGGLSEGEIFSKVLIFDDVYPSAKLNISGVRNRLMYRLDESGNKIQLGTDENGNPIYDQYTIWYFRIEGFTFEWENVIDGLTPSISFQSGALKGREFEIIYYNEDKKITTFDGFVFEAKKGDYEIKFIEENNLIIPSMTGLVPNDGDEVVLFNIKMPSEYTQSAHIELEEELDKAISRMTSDLNNYSFKSNPVAFNESNPQLSIGRAVRYVNGNYSYSTRVIKLTTQLDFPIEQSITIGNEKVKGNTQQLKEEVASANKDLNLLAVFNDMTQAIQQSYNRTQQMMLDGFAAIKNIWQLKETETGEKYIFSAFDVAVQKGITMYANGGLLDLPNIFEGLPIDNNTIYWEEVKDDKGNVVDRVLKSRGVGEGGVTPTLLGDLKNVGSWANAIATEDRIMVQKKDSSSWEALELSKIGGSASFENVKESGAGNAYTSFILSEDKKSLTFLKGKVFAEKSNSLSGYGITDAYTKTNVDSLLSAKWTQNDEKISKWDAAYSWGNHAQAGYFKSADFTKNKIKTTLGISDWALALTKPSYTTKEVAEDTNLYFTNARAVSALSDTLKGYVTLSGAQTISGEKNFTGGLKVNGSPIVYNATGKYWKLTGDLLVTGGITMFGSDSSFSPSTITQAVNVDGTTIINDGKKLMLNPDIQLGGGSDIDLSEYAKKATTLSGYGITDATMKVSYDFRSGNLVTLDVKSSTNAMITVVIRGNSYTHSSAGGKCINTCVEFYNYNVDNLIYNANATHFGFDFGDISVFNYNGYICLWFAGSNTYRTYSVEAFYTNSGAIQSNKVKSITASAMPTSGVTRLVTITPIKGVDTGMYTASDVLAKLKTVAGANSGLDADKLDGNDGSYYASVASLANYLPLSGGVLNGALTTQTVSPSSGNSYDLGSSTLLWRNIYTRKATIDGIEIKKSASGVLYIGGNLVVSGGITMYGTDGTTANTIWDDAPKATTTNNEKGKGIASFDSKFFSVTNGHVTFIGQTGGGGVTDYNDLTNKPDLSVYALKTSLSSYQTKITSSNKLDYDLISGTPTIPTNTNQLTNGAGFITSSGSITGNAATATALKNSRTLWGNSFDGSANVSGNISLVTSKIYWHGDADNYYISCPADTGGAGLMYKAYSSHRFVAGGAERLTILSSGYVGVNNNNPTTSFHVKGTSTFDGDVLARDVRPQSTEAYSIGRYDMLWKGLFLSTDALAPYTEKGISFCDTNGYAVCKIGANSDGIGIYTVGGLYIRGGCTNGSNGTMVPSKTGVVIDKDGNVDATGNITCYYYKNLAFIHQKSGKNLLTDGDVMVKGNAYSMGSYSYDSSVTNGRTYRLTICAKLGSENTHIGAYWDGGGGNSTTITGLSSKEERIVTFTAKITNKQALTFFQFPNGKFGSYVRWAYLEEAYKEGELSTTTDYNNWLDEYEKLDTRSFLYKIQRIDVGDSSYWSADKGLNLIDANAYALTMKRTASNGGTFIKMMANNQTTKSWASGVNNAHQFSWWYQNGDSNVEKMKLDNTGSLSSNYWKLNNSSTNPYLTLTQGSTWYIQGYQGYLYLGAGSEKSMRIDSSGNVLTVGGITMYSDLRKKTILNHVELSLKEVADAPLIEHYYNSDEKKVTHVGSVAQYWAGLNDWFCKEDGEGFLTMEIQNAALASAISVARELTRYESKTDKQIKKLKKRIGELEEEIENLKKV